MSNTINTRIKVKYDTLSNWNSSTWAPLAGEICVAVIPNNTANDYSVGEPQWEQVTINNEIKNVSKLSPYAIGMKVGDGAHRFSDLPWLQAIAGDVYSWAKLPSGGSIPVSYNNSNTTLQNALSSIQTSLGNIVAQGVDPNTLGEALAQLQESLSGNNGYLFSANYEISSGEITSSEVPFQVIRTIEQNGLNINVTGSPLVEEDLQFLFKTQLTAQNRAATILDVTTEIDRINNAITTAMHFRGEITDNSLPNATDQDTYDTYMSGDVVLFGNKEYVYYKSPTNIENSEWIELGDEGSYAVKGSILKSDLSSSLQAEINTIAANAEPNVIEQININGTQQTINNKIVDITLGTLANKSSITSADLDAALAAQIINKGIEISTNNGSYNILSPNSTTNNYRLSKIAETGSIYDVIEGNNNYLILDCGDATHVINLI